MTVWLYESCAFIGNIGNDERPAGEFTFTVEPPRRIFARFLIASRHVPHNLKYLVSFARKVPWITWDLPGSLEVWKKGEILWGNI